MKVGLGNSAVLVALVLFGPVQAIAVSVVKILAGSLMIGSIGSPAFVIGGGAGMAPPGFNSAMPGFGGNLTDAEIWAVLAYIKSRWPKEVLARQRQITARSR